MRKLFIAGSLLLVTSLAWAQPKPLTGFNEPAARQQLDLESTYDSYLSAANVDSGIRIMSSRPHAVGSPGDHAVVDYMYNKFKSWGYNVQVETFYVPCPTPKERLLEMTAGSVSFKASL